MPFEDKTIVCADCGQEFVHSADDQARYAERGFTNEPKRCRECREKRKAQGPGASAGAPRSSGPRDSGGPRPQRSFSGGAGGNRGGGPPRQSYDAVCAECGAATTVPFKPSQGRPVYCRDCFRAKRR